MRLLQKRVALAKKIVEGGDTTKELIEIEKLESQIGEDPADMLYSDSQERIVSYRERVLEMECEKDDFLYSLSGHKGETMESLQKKTFAEIINFAERLNIELNGRH